MLRAARRASRKAQAETSRSSVTPMIKPICSTELVPRQVVRLRAFATTAPEQLTMAQTFALPIRSCGQTLFISKSRRKLRKQFPVADEGNTVDSDIGLG